MQNDWTMNIKQYVMSHTVITHDKFHTIESKMTGSRLFLAPAVTVGETEGAMDSASVLFLSLLLPITL